MGEICRTRKEKYTQTFKMKTLQTTWVPKQLSEDNIKIDLEEIGSRLNSNGLKQIPVTGSFESGIGVLTSQATIRTSTRTLFHELQFLLEPFNFLIQPDYNSFYSKTTCEYLMMLTLRRTKYSNSYLNPHELEGHDKAQFLQK